MSYASRTDLRNRLSEVGLAALIDDDLDSELSSSEHVAATDMALTAADADIDAAFGQLVRSLPLPANDWVTIRAIDLAAEYLASRKGRRVPESLKVRGDLARADLEKVRAGKLRPAGLVYISDAADGSEPRGLPLAANPTVPRSAPHRLCGSSAKLPWGCR